VTVYPLADVLLLALLLRLLLGGGFRDPTVLMLLASFSLLLVGDVGWAGFHRSGTEPTLVQQHLLHQASMAARMLIGGAALHPGVRLLVPEGQTARLGAAGALGLVISVLPAPLVIVLQALLDRLYSVTGF
jgi:hypothetical protein